jgi:nitrate reductase NapAB chaperone NapD
MHYSGIFVRALPSDLQLCADEIDTCEGVDVYLTDPSTSSLVAVIETATLADQQITFRQVRDLPSVVAADLVYHHFEDAAPIEEEVTS